MLQNFLSNRKLIFFKNNTVSFLAALLMVASVLERDLFVKHMCKSRLVHRMILL